MEMEDKVLLIDNGSVKPTSILAARLLASRVSSLIGLPVLHLACQHSDRVPAEALNGEPCLSWSDFLARERNRERKRYLVLPLFFGPSAAIDIKARRVGKRYCDQNMGMVCEFALPLVDLDMPNDDGVARLVSDDVIDKLDTERKDQSICVLVDHGSPRPEIGKCRDLVASQLAEILMPSGIRVIAASMERREGSAYAFNEPLLETVLDRLDLRTTKRVILAFMFFFPGRHAGPGGDIDSICSDSRFVKEGGEILKCALLGEQAGLADVIARRFFQLRDENRNLFRLGVD